jgi:hypothetical protein
VPDAATVDALVRRGRGYLAPHHIEVERSVYLDASQEKVYRDLERLGYITITNATPTLKHRREPGVDVWVELTANGKVASTPAPSGNGWWFSIADRHIISISPAGTGPAPERLLIYNVDFEWQPTELGNELKFTLPDAWKAPAGQFRTQAQLRHTGAGWIIASSASKPVLLGR